MKGFRNGLPTKKYINELIDEFFGNYTYKIRLSSYTLRNGDKMFLVWSGDKINEQVDSFAGFLNEKGIKVGRIRLYKGLTTGSLEIKQSAS